VESAQPIRQFRTWNLVGHVQGHSVSRRNGCVKAEARRKSLPQKPVPD